MASASEIASLQTQITSVQSMIQTNILACLHEITEQPIDPERLHGSLMMISQANEKLSSLQPLNATE